MTNTSTIEKHRTADLEPLSPTLEEQVADIVGAAETDAAEVNLEAEADNTPNLGFSVPMPGVRYYTYL